MAEEPERVDLSSPDLAAEKLAALEELLPGVSADGVLDAARIGELTGREVAGLKEGPERYGLMWAGKHEAVQSLLQPSRGTLIPDLENSVDFDTAENVFIEGDNLEVLKLMQKAYNDQVKLIYIDPPYNTGNDFVYDDDFSDGLRGYLEFTEQVDEEGNRTSANADTAGRIHSRWLSMMFPRLVLARNLLLPGGFIAVSIDDNEVHHLRGLLDEVFGPENFIAQLVWKSKSGGANDSRWIAIDHEYILVYARDAEVAAVNIDRDAVVTTSYPYSDEDGEYGLERLDKQSIRYSESLDFEIVGPDGQRHTPPHKDPRHPNATWRWSRTTVSERFGELVFKDGHVYTKNYRKPGAKPRSLLVGDRFGRTRTGKTELAKQVEGAPFDNPKPPQLLMHLVDVLSDPGETVLDFFAGSGTLADACYRLGQRGEARHFVLVQLPELCPDGSAAANRGYEQISDVSHARILSAADLADDALGLRTFVLAESNFVTDESVAGQAALSLSPQTIKDGEPVPHDLAAEVLLQEGVRLSADWAWPVVGEVDVVLADGVAVVLAGEITGEVVDGAVALEPRVLVFLEDGFAGRDAVKTNAYYACQQAGITMKTV